MPLSTDQIYKFLKMFNEQKQGIFKGHLTAIS